MKKILHPIRSAIKCIFQATEKSQKYNRKLSKEIPKLRTYSHYFGTLESIRKY